MEFSSWAEAMEAGKKHFMAKEFPIAVECFRAATRLDEESAEGWRAFGYAMKENGNSPEAINAFQTAIRLDPDNPEGHLGLGMVHSEMAHQPVAIKEFEEALRLKPEHKQAKLCLVRELVKQGDLHMRNSDKTLAEPSYEAAYKIMPGSPETVVPFVNLLIDTKQYKKVFDIIEAARKVAPRDPQIAELHKEIATDPRLIRAKREFSLLGP